MSKILIETALDQIQDLDTVALKSSLDQLVTLVNQIGVNQIGVNQIGNNQDGIGNLELDEVTMAVKVSAQGAVILVSETQGAITLKFKRSQPISPNFAHDQQLRQISYRKLENALANGQLQEANLETWHILCAALGKTQGTPLTAIDVEQIPCSTLNNIDKLWHKYSNGKFGFTVQSRIYKES